MVAGVLAGGAAASPDAPAPTAASVMKKIDALAAQTESLTEQYNGAQVQIARQQQAIAEAERQIKAAAASYDAARQQFAVIAAARYQSAAFSSTGAILSSHDGNSYLDALAVQQLVAEHSADILRELDASRSAEVAAQQQATKLLAAARDTRTQIGDKRAAVIARTEQMRALLATLTAVERQAYATRGAPTEAEIEAALREPAPSAGARKAVDFAVAQIGKPYVWAASGPDAFDCSGLTMAAWAQAGVSLPHFSAAQYTYGHHVGYDELKPGDLVFLYSDIHHVELYIGNGLAVSAPQEGEPIKVVRVADARNVFYGATRLG